MNVITEPSHSEETALLPATDTVRLEVLPHPFATKRVPHVVAPGASFWRILESCGDRIVSE